MVGVGRRKREYERSVPYLSAPISKGILFVVFGRMRHLCRPRTTATVMERAARAWQNEHGEDDDAEAQTRLWSEPTVDALLSSLTYVRGSGAGFGLAFGQEQAGTAALLD